MPWGYTTVKIISAAGEFIDAAMTAFPRRLSRQLPPPGEYYMTASWRSKRRCFGFFHGDTTYRNNGGTPCDPAASLRRAINIGVSHGMKYIETYQTDAQRLIIRLVPDVG